MEAEENLCLHGADVDASERLVRESFEAFDLGFRRHRDTGKPSSLFLKHAQYQHACNPAAPSSLTHFGQADAILGYERRLTLGSYEPINMNNGSGATGD